jgi:endonuclease G, mitochondrial
MTGIILIAYSQLHHQTNSQNQIPPTTNTPTNLTCPVHLPYGIPTGTPPTNDFLVRDIYCLSSNDETKFADYVAYYLDQATISGNSDQQRIWQPDPDINPNETLEPEDYKGAYNALGTDRGHLAPLASFRGKNWQQTNYLSNIVPMKSVLNRSTWADLENYERDIVRKYGEAYIITGTYYGDSSLKLPQADEPHQIPSGFWKIIKYNGKIESYVFAQDTPKNTDFKSGKTTLTEIEKLTNLELNFLLNYYQE